MPYAYHSNVDWTRYRAAIVEPVAIYRGPDAQFEEVPEQDRRMLADDMQQQFGYALARRWRRTTVAGSDTVRVRLTLTGAKPSKRVLGTVMKVDLGGGSYNAVQAARGKEGAFPVRSAMRWRSSTPKATACSPPMSRNSIPAR